MNYHSAIVNLNCNLAENTIDKFISYNNNETVNVKYTLLSIKKILYSDIQTIDRLINNVNKLTTINLNEYGLVEIGTDSKELFNTLVNDKIIYDDDLNNGNIIAIDEPIDGNRELLDRINNLTNQNNLQLIDIDYFSDNDSQNSLNFDNSDVNIQQLVSKYSKLLKRNLSGDSDSDSF